MMFVPGAFSCTNSPTSCTWRNVVGWYNRLVLVYQNIIFDIVVQDHDLLTQCSSSLSLSCLLPIFQSKHSRSIQDRERIHRQGVGRVDAIFCVRHHIWTSRTCVLSHVVHTVHLSCLALQRARLRSDLLSCNMQANSCNCSVWCWVSPMRADLQHPAPR